MNTESSTSATSQPRPIWDIGAGLLAFVVILLSQQLIGRVISFGLSVTTAIWLVIPLGEIIAVAFLFVYIHQTGRSIRSFLGDLNLRWWEVTLVPIGLFIIGQLFGQVGNLLFSKLGGVGSRHGESRRGYSTANTVAVSLGNFRSNSGWRFL